MDLMKVFNKTVREIKREVNLKVLNVPEIEQKVLDATDDEPWGPHGTVLAEIAQATKKYSECQMVMNVLWTRLSEIDKNWRFIYKSLSVIEYLVANGSERALDDIIEHTYQISSLTSFEYVEPNGKDVGLNVRKKAETITGLLNDKDKIQQVRDKAASNREKYFGLSSSGVTYNSGAASLSGSNFKSSDRYGGFGDAGKNEASYGGYKDTNKYGEDRYEKKTKSRKEPSGFNSKKKDSPATGEVGASTKTNQMYKYASASSKHVTSNKYDDDFDDFDPRGTFNSSKPSPVTTQVDLFGPNFIDMFDAPVSVPNDNSTSLNKIPSEIDLFSESDFVSATSEPETGKSPVPQTKVDLFATQDDSTPMDFFAEPKNEPSKSDTTGDIFDPFSAIPMNSFDETEAQTNVSPIETKSPPKKETFQVKSGIWADSLSCGLIDLNITAPTKVNLADIGIVGGLSDGSEQKENGATMPSFQMGSAMGVGSGIGKSSLASSMSDDDFFSSLSSPQN